jgi:membrane associated rhomboid family serine protease
MFPIGDDDTQRRTFPIVTYALIALNVLMFLVELSGGDQFVNDWAFIPKRFSAEPAAYAVTIFTAMFMHAPVGSISLATCSFCGSSETTLKTVLVMSNS